LLTDFFIYIEQHFGTEGKRLLKSWTNISKSVITCKSQLWFLKMCKQHKVLPAHLRNNKISTSLTFFHNRIRNSHNKVTSAFLYKSLLLEIEDAHRKLTSLHKLRLISHGKLCTFFPRKLLSQFFYYQSRFFIFLQHKQNRIMESKFNWLIKKHEDNIMHDIDAIRYHVSIPPSDKRSYYCSKLRSAVKSSSHSFLPQYSCQPIPSPSTFESYCVSLHSSNYPSLTSCFNLEKNLFTLKPNWFKNLSSTVIPEDVISLLQLGEKFSLPVSAPQKNYVVHEYNKNMEKIFGVYIRM